MKRLLPAFLLLSTMLLRGADSTPARPRELSWDMHLAQLQAHSNDGLRLVALLRADDKELALEINIPGNVKRADKASDGAFNYRFPLYLRASEADAAVFARLIAAHFEPKRPASFIRNEEYAGASLKKPRRLAQDGGTILVSDPTGTPFAWSIRLKIEPAPRRLILTASETPH